MKKNTMVVRWRPGSPPESPGSESYSQKSGGTRATAGSPGSAILAPLSMTGLEISRNLLEDSEYQLYPHYIMKYHESCHTRIPPQICGDLIGIVDGIFHGGFMGFVMGLNRVFALETNTANWKSLEITICNRQINHFYGPFSVATWTMTKGNW